MVKRIVLLGAPGGGKGTQAKKIVQFFGVDHISTGDMLRAARSQGTPLGKKAAEFMDKGLLVPDELVIGLVKERVENCLSGFVLDGFPRNRTQAEALEKAGIDVDTVININVDEDVIVRRITGRRSCPNCGAVYHIEFSPSKDKIHCDNCHVALITRDDDKEETVRSRLKVYHENTAPLIQYYMNKGILQEVDGNADPDTVFERIKQVLSDVANR